MHVVFQVRPVKTSEAHRGVRKILLVCADFDFEGFDHTFTMPSIFQCPLRLAQRYRLGDKQGMGHALAPQACCGCFQAYVKP